MDMISLPIELDKNKTDGYYRLVIATVKRAKELSQGAQPRVSSKAKKVTTLALEEIVSGAVEILTDEAAVKAMEEAKKLAHKQMMDEAKQRESMPEDLTELEKNLKMYLTEKGERDSKKAIEDIFGDNLS